MDSTEEVNQQPAREEKKKSKKKFKLPLNQVVPGADDYAREESKEAPEDTDVVKTSKAKRKKTKKHDMVVVANTEAYESDNNKVVSTNNGRYTEGAEEERLEEPKIVSDGGFVGTEMMSAREETKELHYEEVKKKKKKKRREEASSEPVDANEAPSNEDRQASYRGVSHLGGDTATFQITQLINQDYGSAESQMQQSKSNELLNRRIGLRSNNKTQRDTKFSGMGLISNKSFVINQTIETNQSKSPQKQRQPDQPMVSSNEKIKVFVRVRPFMKAEIGKVDVVFTDKYNQGHIQVSDGGRYLESTYNRVFEQKTSQREIFDSVQYCLDSVLNGFNSTIFAYGQTGSGKTYTIFGDGFQTNTIQQIIQREDLRQQNITMNMDSEAFKVLKKSKLGIIPRTVSHIFKQIENNAMKCTVYMSFMQIYNEEIYDMLGNQKRNKRFGERGLRIREDTVQGTYVEGLTEYIVTDKEQCFELLIKGERIRAKRSTRLNMQSSRSHTIFQIVIESDEADEKGMIKRAKLNIGDLAGSEKIFLDEFPSAQHLNELKNINLSLTTLGKVISKLSQKNQTHIPFRDSKLTRLLQDSLGGNTRTCLIATVSPHAEFVDESISTLKFADRTKCVSMKISKNEINAQDDALVSKLQKEIQYLKDLLQMRRKGVDKQDLQQQLFRLKEENDRLRELALTVNDVQRIKQENKKMRIEMQMIMNESGMQAEMNGNEDQEEEDEEEGTPYKVEEEKPYSSSSQPQPIVQKLGSRNMNQINQSKTKYTIRSINQQQVRKTRNEGSPSSSIFVQNSTNGQLYRNGYENRRIQDTGATEELEQPPSQGSQDRPITTADLPSSQGSQPLLIHDDAEIIHDSTETGDIVIGKSRLPRKVISEMIEKQKKLKISRKQYIRMNDEQAGEDNEEDDFASYYNPELIGDSSLQQQSLNHSRNMAGISVIKSITSEQFPRPLQASVLMRQITSTFQESQPNEPQQVYNNVRQLLKRGSDKGSKEIEIKKQQRSESDSSQNRRAYYPKSKDASPAPNYSHQSLQSQSYLPTISRTQIQQHSSQVQHQSMSAVTTVTPYPNHTPQKLNTFKSTRTVRKSPRNVASDPYLEGSTKSHLIQSRNNVNLTKSTENPDQRSVRYRGSKAKDVLDQIQRSAIKEQPSYMHQLRRKSNPSDNNTHRSRNSNIVTGSVNVNHFNQQRRSLPRMSEEDHQAAVSHQQLNRRRIIQAGSIIKTYDEQERRKRSEQESVYKKATERLQMLEQLEQDRKRRFEQELDRLAREQQNQTPNFISQSTFHNRITSQRPSQAAGGAKNQAIRGYYNKY